MELNGDNKKYCSAVLVVFKLLRTSRWLETMQSKEPFWPYSIKKMNYNDIRSVLVERSTCLCILLV